MLILAPIVVVIILLSGGREPPVVHPARMLDAARVAQAQAQMRNFDTAIQMYYLQNRKLPTSLEVLTEEDARTGEAYLDRIPLDPWGHDFELRLLGRKEFTIRSAGADGEFETDDDVILPDGR